MPYSRISLNYIYLIGFVFWGGHCEAQSLPSALDLKTPLFGLLYGPKALDPNAQCSLEEEKEAQTFFKTQDPLSLKSYRCKDVFLEKPPLKALGQVEWWPFCSLSFFNFIYGANPNLKLDHALLTYHDVFGKTDYCQENEKNRFSSGFNGGVPLAVEKIESIQKPKFKESYYFQMKAYAAQCCDYFPENRLSCLKHFHSVQARFCGEITNYEQQLLCERQGLAFYPKQPGHEIRIAKRFTKPYEFENSLNHEAAHVCSYYFFGNAPQVFAEALKCELTPFLVKKYKELFQKFKMSEDSVACVMEVIEKAPSCEGGCTAIQLEETFAFWITAQNALEKSDLGFLCNGARDGHHPLPLDLTRCFLKTPAFQKTVEKASQCKK